MTRRDDRRGHGSGAVAGAFIGTVVGAGFASGQETLRFFTAFGAAGLMGLALATVLFVVFGVRILSLGARYGASSHRPLVLHATGPRFGPAFDVLLALLLLATAAAMASGAASALAEQFGWPRWLGALFMVAVSAVTVLGGIGGVVKAVAAVAPLLIASILLISLSSLAVPPVPGGGPGSPPGMEQPEGPGSVPAPPTVPATRGLLHGLTVALRWSGRPGLGAAGTWWTAALLYVAYNMLLAMPVLAPLGAVADGRLPSGVGVSWVERVWAWAPPPSTSPSRPACPPRPQWTFRCCSRPATLPPWIAITYSVLLLAEVYTTAVALLFGFAARIGEHGRRAFRPAVLGGAVVAWAGGLVPFAKVVATLYPVIGVLGLVLMAGLFRPPRP